MTYERLGQTFRCGHCHTDMSPPGAPVEVTSEAGFEGLIQGCPWPVVVDFWAAWCGPCKMVAPEIAKVAAESAGRWILAKVNTEELPLLAQRFQVASLPTIAVFRNGREIARQAGAMPAPAIRQFVERAI